LVVMLFSASVCADSHDLSSSLSLPAVYLTSRSRIKVS
jgi:hypothetical protein